MLVPAAFAATFAPDAQDAPGVELAAGPALLVRSIAVPGAHVAGRAQAGRWAVHFAGTGFTGPDLFAVAGVRWSVVDHPGFHLAPFAVVADHVGPSSLDHRATARLGLAVEGGGEHLRLDLSLPLVGGQYFWDPDVETRLSLLSPLETVLSLEGGVGWRFGDHHTAHLGLVGILPALGWETRTDRWVVHVVAASMGPNSLFLARVGARVGSGATLAP